MKIHAAQVPNLTFKVSLPDGLARWGCVYGKLVAENRFCVEYRLKARLARTLHRFLCPCLSFMLAITSPALFHRCEADVGILKALVLSKVCAIQL